jgi:hypothetical protein
MSVNAKTGDRGYGWSHQQLRKELEIPRTNAKAFGRTADNQSESGQRLPPSPPGASAGRRAQAPQPRLTFGAAGANSPLGAGSGTPRLVACGCIVSRCIDYAFRGDDPKAWGRSNLLPSPWRGAPSEPQRKWAPRSGATLRPIVVLPVSPGYLRVRGAERSDGPRRPTD